MKTLYAKLFILSVLVLTYAGPVFAGGGAGP